MSSVIVNGKHFVPYLSEAALAEKVTGIAQRLNHDFTGKDPVFLAVLNGAFMFVADLFRKINIPCEVSFVKMASYEGMQSTGRMKKLIGLNENLRGRHVVVVEDIVDTGNTMMALLAQLQELEPAGISICTLLCKPTALLHELQLDYVALEVPEHFFLGYGLDYDGHGRNLPTLYHLSEG
ncbi:MAG: phosphoribosyltransferase [Bacteroidia bacterium]|jgi:hypoxanthine phosphoribosyltransferase